MTIIPLSRNGSFRVVQKLDRLRAFIILNYLLKNIMRDCLEGKEWNGMEGGRKFNKLN